MGRMKELTVCIQNEYEGKVIYRTELYTEEEYKQLEKENKKLNEYNRRLKQGNDDLKEQNKKLKEDNRFLTKISKEYMEKEGIIQVTEFTGLYKDDLEKENKKLKETIKDHILYEEKLEHRIIELEELLHGE